MKHIGVLERVARLISQREDRRMAVALADLLAVTLAHRPEPIDRASTPPEGGLRG